MALERYLTYRNFLVDELKKRQTQDRNYSLRAFAKELNVRSSRLSEILSGKVGLSEERALHIAQSLKISDEETKIFVDLVQSTHGRGVVTKKLAAERLRQRFPEARQLQLDEIEVIADWYHSAMLELIKSDNSDHSVPYMSRRLGVPEATVQEAVERLLRLGLVAPEGAGFKLGHEHRTTVSNIPSSAIRECHRQILQKAENSLEARAVGERDFSALMFSIQKHQVPALKEFLMKMRRELKGELEQIGKTPGEVPQEKDSVYCFSAQLFELTENA
jgi:uncharacterized protein (TIGR02147 family)